MLYNRTPLPSKLPISHGGSGPHLIHGSLGPPESWSQTASRSVQPFLQGWCDRPTDHALRSVTVGGIYVRSTAMRPNNNGNDTTICDTAKSLVGPITAPYIVDNSANLSSRSYAISSCDIYRRGSCDSCIPYLRLWVIDRAFCYLSRRHAWMVFVRAAAAAAATAVTSCFHNSNDRLARDADRLN